MGDVCVQNGPETLNRVQVWAIGGQLDQVDAALRSGKPLFNGITPVIGRVVPNYVNGSHGWVICFDFRQKLHRAIAVNGDRFDKRRVEVFKAERAMNIDPSPTSGGFDGGV